MAKNTTARGFGKRTLALFLSLVMMTSLLNIGALAADTIDMVQNFGDTYYKQDGSAGTASDWEIHLSKTAAETGTDNVYDITLTVETKDTSVELAGATHGAAVLVLDFSSSMVDNAGDCTDCGEDERHENHQHPHAPVDIHYAVHPLEPKESAARKFPEQDTNT